MKDKMNKRFTYALRHMAVLCAVMALMMGYVTAMKPVTAQAAVIINKSDDSTKLNPTYKWTYRYNSDTTVKTSGMDNKPFDIYRNPDFYYQEIISDSQKGNISIRYSNVGDYGSVPLDLEITAIDWGRTYIESIRGEDLKTVPVIAFNLDNIGCNIRGVEQVRFRFVFYEHETSKAVNLKGHATLMDLDYGQCFGFDNGGNVNEVYIRKDSILGIDGNKVTSPDDITTEDDDKSSWSMIFFHNDFYLDFYCSPTKGNTGRNEQGIVDISHFAFTAKAPSGVWAPLDAPLKGAVESGGSYENASKSDQPSQGYEIPDSGVFDYVIRQSMAPNELKSFVFQDTVEDVLIYKNITITDSEGNNMNSCFDISVNGSHITASATAAAIDSSVFLTRNHFDFHITVQLDKSKLVADRKLSSPKYFTDNQNPYKFFIPNIATVSMVATTGEVIVGKADGSAAETNQVWAQGTMTFTPVIHKTTSYEYQVGDIVPYEVTLQIKDEDSFATGLVLYDTSLPEGLTVQADSLKIAGMDNAEIAPQGNGWKVTVPIMYYGEVLKVNFQALVTEAVNGQEITNAVSAEADNVDPDNPIEGDPDIDEWNNSPQLTIAKEAGKEEYRVGEQVDYTLVVTNVKKGTIAKKIVISDDTLPDGCVLNPQETVKITGFPEMIEYPVQDSTGELATRQQKNSCKLSVEDNKLHINMMYLPADTPVTIQFSCVPQESLNGMEIVNTAKVSAENVKEEVRDDALIWVNSPVLKVVKEADKEIYRAGDVITYTVTGTQEQSGCVARNITFEDTIATEGVTLQKNSIVLLDENNKKIDAQVEVQGNHFLLKSGNHLVFPENYLRWDKIQKPEEPIMQNVYNPLKLEKEKTMTLEYQVVIVDEKLAGKSIENKVMINCDEDYPQETEEQVPVYGPVLNLSKTSDKQNVKVGDLVHYTLTVTQGRDGVTADNVTVTDNFPENVREFVEIQPDSLVMKVDEKLLENTEITCEDYSITARSNHDLAYGEKLTLEYDVKVLSATDEKVVNLATASADNTEPVEDHNEITIGEDKPILEQTKKADKEKVQVGDVVHYTVATRQTRDGAVALNVVLTDSIRKKDRPYVKLLEESIQIKVDDKTLTDAQIISENGTIKAQTNYKLSFGETMILEYDVEYIKKSKENIKNTATATADNAGKVTSETEVTPLEETVTPASTSTPAVTIVPGSTAAKNTPGSYSSGGTTIASMVKTGDATVIALFLGMLLLAAVIMTGVVFIRKIRKNK